MNAKLTPADLAMAPLTMAPQVSSRDDASEPMKTVMYTITNNGGRPSDRDPDLVGAWNPNVQDIVMGTYTRNTGRRSDKD